MRSLKCLAVWTTMMSLCGCSKDLPPIVTNAPAVLNVPPADSSENTPFTEEDAPDFDPKLTLEWPGTPEESRRRINAGMADETTIYSATLFQTETGTVTILGASVYQFIEKDLQGSDPKEMLVGHRTIGGEIELTRQQLEQGPNKLLGFDVIVKEDGGLRRSALWRGAMMRCSLAFFCCFSPIAGVSLFAGHGFWEGPPDGLWRIPSLLIPLIFVDCVGLFFAALLWQMLRFALWHEEWEPHRNTLIMRRGLMRFLHSGELLLEPHVEQDRHGPQAAGSDLRW